MNPTLPIRGSTVDGQGFLDSSCLPLAIARNTCPLAGGEDHEFILILGTPAPLYSRPSLLKDSSTVHQTVLAT